MIARFDLAAIDDLREALPRFRQRPLAHLRHATADQINAWWLDEIRRDVADDSAIVLASINSGIVEGLIVYSDSPWDSKIVGRRIGTLKHLAAIEDGRDADIFDDLIGEVIRQLVDRGIECVTSKVSPDDVSAVHAFERRGFLLMDTLLDFVVDFSRTPLNQLDPPKKIESLKYSSSETGGSSRAYRAERKSFR